MCSEPLRIVELERFDPGDGHAFWRATADWCGVVIVFHDRWGRWLTDDFAIGAPYAAAGWLADALDQAVLRAERGGVA
jgi:hypothetical protein